MKKYLRFFKTNLQQFFEYRGDLTISLLLKLFTFIAFSFVWMRISEEGNEIRGYGLQGVILYYLLTIILHGFITSQTARDLRDNILTGQLSSRLVKPFKITIYFFIKHLARITSETLFHMLLVLPIFVFLPSLLEGFSIGMSNLLHFGIFLVGSTITNFNIFFAVGTVAFWTKQAHGLQSVIRNSTRLFTGELIPIDLFPSALLKFTKLLPFQYILFFPIKSILSDLRSQEVVDALIVILIWNAFLVSINFILWNLGLKKYEAVGI